MKQLTAKASLKRLRIRIITTVLVIISLFLFSFTANKLTDNFLQQLGISKSKADEKITGSILGGYLDQYGVSSAKNIVLGKRAAVAKDLLIYTKQYVSGAAFIKGYNELKESQKPVKNKIQTPEEIRKETIDMYKKSIAETEASMKNADASLKKIFEEALQSGKKQLKEAEDPNNKFYKNYKAQYDEMVKFNEASYSSQLAEWEKKYPANHLLFVKLRLQQFMEETAGIDFDAQLTEKNGKKYFTNPTYEHKGNRWKMAFRAGKEVVETARDFAAQWISEIK